MPAPMDYPNGLGHYQRLRVNRLIIDAVIDNDQILRQGAYLSTSGVLDASIRAVDLKAITEVVVLAHPAHLPRCLQQVESALKLQGAQRIAVIPGLSAVQWPWDDQVAQQWCCSEGAWSAYEQQVRLGSNQRKL